MDMEWVIPEGSERDPIITGKQHIKVRRLVKRGIPETQRQVCSFAFITITTEGKFRVRIGTPGDWNVAKRDYTTLSEHDTLEEAQAVAVAAYRTQ